MKLIQTAGACALALVLASAASPAAAQLGPLNRLVPGASTSNAAAVDPDAFLAETLETTKMMMVAAFVLARASETDGSRDEMRAELAELQGMSSMDELNARQDQFEADLAAVNANYSDADGVRAKYDAASREQQELLLSAAYNFTLAMVRNVQLAQQAPDLLQSIGRNPMLLRKAGSLRSAASLVGKQVNAARSMGEPLRILMSRGGVEAPTDAEASEPRTVTI